MTETSEQKIGKPSDRIPKSKEFHSGKKYLIINSIVSLVAGFALGGLFTKGEYFTLNQTFQTLSIYTLLATTVVPTLTTTLEAMYEYGLRGREPFPYAWRSSVQTKTTANPKGYTDVRELNHSLYTGMSAGLVGIVLGIMTGTISNISNN